MARYPELSATLYADWGSLVSTCALKDLLFGQTNGVIGTDSTGQPIHFDTTQYLDGTGSVLPGRAREYNAATRANTILRTALTEWQADPTCLQSPPLNNKCCDPNSALPGCISATSKRCDMDGTGLNCVAGSTQC